MRSGAPAQDVYIIGNDVVSLPEAAHVASIALLESEARTQDANSDDQINESGQGILLYINISIVGSGTITPQIQVKDSVSENYRTIWAATTALATNGLHVYALAPGAGALSYTEFAPLLLGRTWRLRMIAVNANVCTYSASADVI